MGIRRLDCSPRYERLEKGGGDGSPFKDELGYRAVRPWAIYDSSARGARIAYFMIHASDHARADTLMSSAYSEVLSRSPHMDQPELFSG